MNKENMTETAETYYDGTTDEELMDVVEDDPEEESADDDAEVEAEDFTDPDEDADETEDNEADDTGEEGEDPEAQPEKAPENNEYKELAEAARELLKSLGLDKAENPALELKKLTAEALGISTEEYDRREKAVKEAQAAWDAQAQRDIEAIHEAFPETKKYKSLLDLPNKEKFAELMDDKRKNLSAVEAFAASHLDIVKAHNRAPGKNSNLNGTKDHIKSNVPKGAKDTSTFISKSEMETYREMFPELSDQQIKKLYKSTNK